jgi:Ni/Co efflux regulator RcnB
MLIGATTTRTGLKVHAELDKRHLPQRNQDHMSSHNHDNGGTVNWGAVHGVGASFLYVKATEGGDYLNPNFRANFAAVHDVRLGLHGPPDPMRWARQARLYFAASLLVGFVGSSP